MKYLYICGLVSLLCACSPEIEERRNVFIVDVSDKDTPELNNIFREGGIGYPKGSMWDGYATEYIILANSDYPKLRSYSIEAKTQWLSNEDEREEKFNTYIQNIQSLKHEDTIEYPGSIIWKPLCLTLNRLSEDSQSQTTIYLVSNLLENSSEISLYNPKVKATLEHDPEAIRELFRLKMLPLEHTDHLEVVLVHEPSVNTEINEYYALIVEEIYKSLLEEVGVKVSVRSKL